MSELGQVHVTFGFLALIFGAVVLLMPKGTRIHRTLGHFYVSSMLGLNVTALLIYNLFGTFGPFHWLSLMSLITLMAGFIPVVLQRPKRAWLTLHAGAISGSYVGLVSAAISEVTTRLPGFSFWWAVAIPTGLITYAGIYLIQLKMPAAIRNIRTG